MSILFILFILLLTTSIIDGDFKTNYNVSSGVHSPKCNLKGFDINILELSQSTFSPNIYEVGKRYLELQCEADYPIDFEFNGQTPKGDELCVNFFNIFEGGKITFNVRINYTELQDSNLAGEYSVFSVDNTSTLRTTIYVFDAKNVAREPQLFTTNIDDNKIGLLADNTTGIIRCKTNVIDVPVLLFRYPRYDHDPKKKEEIGPSKLIYYDPSRGFICNVSEQTESLEDAIENFRYVCKCDKCKNGSKSVEFTFTLNPEKITKEYATNWLTLDIKVINGETRIICKDIWSPVPDPYVTNIFAENPRQLRLIAGCLAKGRHEKHDCANKKTAGSAYSNMVTLHSAHSHGLAYCSHQNNSRIQITREYFRGFDDIIYYDWNVARNSPDALLKIGCQNDETIYANLTYSFTCSFVSYILSPPSFFQLHFTDGSTDLYVYQPGDSDRYEQKTREVSFTLFSNITKVSCSSLPWNSSVFIKSSKAFILRDKRRPEFVVMEENMKFLLGSNNTELLCIANGDELPDIIWEKNGMALNETNLEVKYGLGRSTIGFPFIRYEHGGEYKCNAKNSMGIVTKLYRIDIEDPHGTNYGLLAGLLLGALAILFIAILISYTIFRHFRNKKLYLTKNEIEEFKHGANRAHKTEESGDNLMRFMENIESGPYNEKYEIYSSQFQIDRTFILGCGQFGIVYKGLYNHEPIAIKTIKPYTQKIYLKSLLSEIKVMIHINGHNHIVNLVGANTASLKRGMVYAFVEFCPLGSLEEFLRKYRNNFVSQISGEGTIEILNENANMPNSLCTRDLVLWSGQISSGMEYLTSKNVIHGDLATRNILLSNRETIKISDFGLAKKLYDYTIYQKKNKVPLPWRWMAIESLQNLTFSTKTDVWAFGVTLWEIFTLANVPYPGLSWTPDFVKLLQSNMRLPQPNYATTEIYNVMTRCWNIEPENRPSFACLNKFFMDYVKKFSPPSEYTDFVLDTED